MTIGTERVVSMRGRERKRRRTDGDSDSLCDGEHDELTTDCQSIDKSLHDLSVGRSSYHVLVS